MAIGQKYLALTHYLQTCGKPQITMTFREISRIVPLPDSAYTTRQLWANSGQSFSSAWMNAGYRTRAVQMDLQTLQFVRGSAAPPSRSPVPAPQTVFLPEQTVRELLLGGQACLNEILRDPHHRYRSWEYCFQAFSDAACGGPEDPDILALHLAWYLGSWGMLRNSFLQNKDYKIHIPAAVLLLEHRWDTLRSLPGPALAEQETASKIMELSEALRACYRQSAGGTPTDTLLTKILLGTLGCVPAYDRYFKTAVRQTRAASGNFGVRSLQQLGCFYQQYEAPLESLRTGCPSGCVPYTAAKLLDMCFFGYGLLHDPASRAD